MQRTVDDDLISRSEERSRQSSRLSRSTNYMNKLGIDYSSLVFNRFLLRYNNIHFVYFCRILE